MSLHDQQMICKCRADDIALIRLVRALLSAKVGAATLGVFAAASVALACCGAEGALGFMKYYAAIGTVGAFAAVCLVRAVCDRPLLRPALLFHLGFALVLGGWTYNELCGTPGGYLQLRAGQTGQVDDAFNLSVRDFRIERYPDTGTVSQYRCQAEIEAPGEPVQPVEISVNHPLVKKGWWVYQSSYQEMENPHTGGTVYFTILECVKDVGLPSAAAGALLLMLAALWWAVRLTRAGSGGASVADDGHGAPPSTMSRIVWSLYGLAFAGAVAMLVHRGLATGHPPMQNLYEFLMCAAALVPVLTFVSARCDRQNTLLVDALLLALVMIPVGFVMDGRVKHLMPALQSPFFVPHVGSYVLGYILLVRAAMGAGVRLVGAGFFLLTVGLVLGAAWGKVCWGHWWQFDPKEMWSLATWFVYAAYFHLRPRLSAKAQRAFLIAGAVMVVLTLTWINLSRLFTGMHSYA